MSVQTDDILRDLESHSLRIRALTFMPDPQRPWLTTREACVMLGVHRNTLAQWRRTGALRGSQRMRKGDWKYHIQDLMRLME